ncbi:uncharacterized protein LOC120534120 isoform X10 [Polypterus senegalus]|uniref:uncharacterized protein LOC120534120 isoform X10 n=1 Tax=Polypterus senegalus TaxID=55291 RepID=UPI0019641AC5|nr:uncharacterized protein LOC120534120 isoform X10 [Polypterus senegalus]
MILTFFLCLLTLNCSLVCPRGIDTASLKRSTTEDANIDEHLQGKNETILNATQVDLPERNMTLDNSTCVFNNTKSEQENGNYTDIDEHLQGKNETILNATQVDLPERNMTLNNSTCVFNNIKSEQDNGNYPEPNKLMLQRCNLPTCATNNLIHAIAGGADENAGKATSDPYGFGKRK